MNVRLAPNKFERGVIKRWAEEEHVKPWQIMRELSQFGAEAIFKRYFEKAYKEEKANEYTYHDAKRGTGNVLPPQSNTDNG